MSLCVLVVVTLYHIIIQVAPSKPLEVLLLEKNRCELVTVDSNT